MSGNLRYLGGVFRGSHAVAAGAMTTAQLRAMPVFRVLQGVYADTSQTRDHLLKCQAAAVLMPERAALGGWSAAALLGAPQPGYGEPVTVLVPEDAQWKGPRGVRVRRVSLPAADVVRRDDGQHHTTPSRTAWDLAALETTPTAVGVLDAMLRSGTITEDDLQRLLLGGTGRWGVVKVRRAFGLVDRRAMSPPESWLRVACILAGLPAPVPQFRVCDGDRFLGEGDLVWPEHKLVVEYEGEYHFDGVQIVKDDARYAAMIAAGWRVIRVAAHDLRSMDDLVRRIAAALALA